jgi:Acyl-protein synthetase, LuxE
LNRYGESDALHARAHAFVHAFEEGRRTPEPFDTLACDLARYQAAHVPGYARLCRARGLDPTSFVRAGDAPAVPTDAFKATRVAAFEPANASATFRTSGTTIGARGTHAMRDVRTYDDAALAFGRWALARDLPPRVQVLVLGPPPDEAPDSSLTHMLALFVRELSTDPSRAFFLRDGIFELGALSETIARLDPSGPGALLLGTSFAFVHLIDALDGATFPLPRGSRVMQTGGYKGKSREVAPDALRAEIARTFGVSSIVSEYGMTELSSQFYDAQPRPGVYAEPPWARVVPVHPETLAPVAEGDVGIARIEDLMNVDSAFAVLAADRVKRVDGGFELLGRAPGAAPRGCSIAVDEMIGPS